MTLLATLLGRQKAGVANACKEGKSPSSHLILSLLPYNIRMLSWIRQHSWFVSEVQFFSTWVFWTEMVVLNRLLSVSHSHSVSIISYFIVFFSRRLVSLQVNINNYLISWAKKRICLINTGHRSLLQITISRLMWAVQHDAASSGISYLQPLLHNRG